MLTPTIHDAQVLSALPSHQQQQEQQHPEPADIIHVRARDVGLPHCICNFVDICLQDVSFIFTLHILSRLQAPAAGHCIEIPFVLAHATKRAPLHPIAVHACRCTVHALWCFDVCVAPSGDP